MIDRMPSVYVSEKFAAPGAGVVEVATGTPLFIGHSAFARSDGRSIAGKPVAVGSMAEFELLFGGRARRLFHVAQGEPKPGDRDHGPAMPGSAWRLRETAAPIYRLRDSVALFFANGGRQCFVISCGDHATPPSAGGLIAALSPALGLFEPSMLLIPDMAALDAEGHARVAAAMLDHCGTKMRDRMAIYDLWGADTLPDGADFELLMAGFRASFDRSPLDSLAFGAAYFPYLETSLLRADDIDMRWFDLSDPARSALLAALRAQAPDVARIAPLLDAVGNTVDDDEPPTPGRYGHRQLARSLGVGIPGFEDLRAAIAAAESRLPASGAMAGLWARTDALLGYWRPPANLSIATAKAPSARIDDAAQRDMNAPLDGRAVNPIRVLPGRGLVAWSGLTLDANSFDWRYIAVRRAAICIEQSIRIAMQNHVFEKNDATTWQAIQDEVTAYLNDLWTRGALAGATAEDAFKVAIGLGSTMTAQDVLDGRLILAIQLALGRPAEFILLSIVQQQGA